MAPWNNRTSQSSGVIGKAIKEHLEEGELLLNDVLVTRDRALALTDRRLLEFSLRNNFLKRSVRVREVPFKEICGLEVDDLCPHYINGTRPSGFKLKLTNAQGQVIAEWFGENDAIDTAFQLLLELQYQLHLQHDRVLVDMPAWRERSELPDELGRKLNFMLEQDECIRFELQGKNGRAICVTDQRLILVRRDREASSIWGENSVIEIPYSRLDRILTSSQIVNPQIVMHMAVYFERFGEPLPGGRAEHLSVLGAHWTDVLHLALVAIALKHSLRQSYVAGLVGLS
ncbi:hypothetical protein KDL29_15660 [bacterium]|nr:hypothetical protein [bacterium]